MYKIQDQNDKIKTLSPVGKVERSHRRLTEKILYDMITLVKKGVNWTSNLGSYSRITRKAKKNLDGGPKPLRGAFWSKIKYPCKSLLGRIAF